jgi:hypothetical protein
MPISTGYPVSQIVNVTVNLSPVAAATRNFGATLAVGGSEVIDVTERIRSYGSLTEVGADFGSTMPEYLAATAFFAQSPKPSLFYIGRWAQTDTAGLLLGGALSAADQTLANFTAINAGKLTLTIDGVVTAMVGIDLSGAGNLNAVAAAITAELAAAATCTWDSVRGRFIIESATAGDTSTLSFPAVVAGDESLSEVMGLRATDGASLVDGVESETLAEAVTLLAEMSNAWYFVGIAATGTGAADADMPAVAAVVEALSPVRFAGFTTQDPNVLVSTATTDLAYVLKAATLSRSFVQYSSSNPYAVFSLMGRGATINFNGSNTTITYKFKQEPGVTVETMTVAQYASARTKRANVFIHLNNDTTIVQEGVTAAGYFIDEIQGTDWLANDVETAIFNTLYGSNKVPQTDAGVNRLIAAAAARCAQAVANGLAAPGTWDADGFGELSTGDFLQNGFYIYCPPVSTQSAADRAARIAPTMQIALKLAGAVHFVFTIIQTNR